MMMKRGAFSYRILSIAVSFYNPLLSLSRTLHFYTHGDINDITLQKRCSMPLDSGRLLRLSD